MRALWRGEEVEPPGRCGRSARLWSLPDEPPRWLPARSARRPPLGGAVGRRADHREPARDSCARSSMPTAGRVAAALSRCRCTWPTRHRRGGVAIALTSGAAIVCPRCWWVSTRPDIRGRDRARPGRRRSPHVRVSADLGATWLAAGVSRPGFEELYLHHVGQHHGVHRRRSAPRPAYPSQVAVCDDAGPATCGGRRPSSTALMCRPSTIPTATASAISRGCPTARPPGRARRHRGVADAVLPDGGCRRRLRHHRLLHRGPTVGHAR